MKVLLAIALLVAVVSAQERHFNGTTLQLPSPMKILYIDWAGINWNDPSSTVTACVDAGFNIIIIAFLLSSGAADMALAWQGLDAGTKQNAISYAHSKGAYVLVSAGGSTDSPYGSMSGQAYGSFVGNWASQNLMDGVDFDMENFGPPLVASGLSPQQTIQWLADATNSARSVLGSNSLISHAPQAPYFGRVGGGSGTNPWTGSTGGYTAVYNAAPTIDFFNMQFYNQGATCYVDYAGLFTNSNSCGAFPGTSVYEISSYGIPLSKIAVGKPLTTADAGTGYVDAGSLAGFVKQASSDIGWSTGVMGWVWMDQSDSANWINTIYP